MFMILLLLIIRAPPVGATAVLWCSLPLSTWTRQPPCHNFIFLLKIKPVAAAAGMCRLLPLSKRASPGHNLVLLPVSTRCCLLLVTARPVAAAVHLLPVPTWTGHEVVCLKPRKDEAHCCSGPAAPPCGKQSTEESRTHQNITRSEHLGVSDKGVLVTDTSGEQGAGLF
jgi:hypothetical protein